MGLAVATRSRNTRLVHAFGFYDTNGTPLALCGVGRSGLINLERPFRAERRACPNCIRLFSALAVGWAEETLHAANATREPDQADDEAALYRRLQSRADSEGVDLSSLMCSLVRRFLDDNELAADVIAAAHC
jgi:hypothetical protein